MSSSPVNDAAFTEKDDIVSTEQQPGSDNLDNVADEHTSPVISQGHHATTTGKPKKRGKKSMAQRGPTALPRNRGTGFEGVTCMSKTSLKEC
jgi:hypothetical protein